MQCSWRELREISGITSIIGEPFRCSLSGPASPQRADVTGFTCLPASASRSTPGYPQRDALIVTLGGAYQDVHVIVPLPVLHLVVSAGSPPCFSWRCPGWLPLSAFPVSARAVGAIAAIAAAHEAAVEKRKTGRRQSGLDKQRHAVGVIVGGVLRCWGRRVPHSVFRSRTPASFTGGPVAARQYLAACDALVSIRLLHRSQSIRYELQWDDDGPEMFSGKAPRLWPSQALLNIVARRGITPATLADDFGDVYPTKPPTVPEPLQVFTLKQRGRAEKAPIRIRLGNPEATHIRNEVETFNGWVAQHDIRGCLPPRFKRVFTASRLLGGHCSRE
jgi:hypothetical protein